MSLRDPEFRESLEGFFATSRLESEPKLPHHLVSGVGKRRFITSSPTPTAHARCSHAVGVRPLLRELAADRDPSLGAPAGGMNAATRAIVRYCVRQGHKPFAIHNGFVGLLDDNVHQLSWLGVDNWTTRGGSELGTNRKLPDIDLGAVAAKFQQYNFHALIMIGGFEAFSSLLILEQGRKHYPAFNIPMVHLPATISNNVPMTEFSLGSDTSLNALVDACDAIKQSASASRNRVFVVETQGGKCGYIATMGALAVR